MRYYSIRFKVEKKDGGHYWFISGNLWKSKEDALEHARQFALKCAEEDEVITYELETFQVVEP